MLDQIMDIQYTSDLRYECPKVWIVNLNLWFGYVIPKVWMLYRILSIPSVNGWFQNLPKPEIVMSNPAYSLYQWTSEVVSEISETSYD